MRGSVLILETSTESGSVAVVRDGSLVAALSFVSRDPATGARTEALAPAVVECLGAAGISVRDISAVICGAGPGGFTSLRGAASFAKGLCSALHIPLYAVSSLEFLAWSGDLPEGRFTVALHAGRNEWFCQDVESDGDRSDTVGTWSIVGDDALRDRAASKHAPLVGPALEVDVVPVASAATARMADIESRGPVDLDSWEPVYGRLAEAQVKWEAAHGRSLAV